MTETEILQGVDQGEAVNWEFKSAKGGVPKTLYDTYSAMANTGGGVVVLGVEENEAADHAEPNRFWISGLQNASHARKSIWDTLNNRGKVSINLLRDEDISVRTIADKEVIVLRIPKADRRQRPVFLDQNPLGGTYRRNYEGDYHCSQEEVRRMLADQTEETPDSRILEHFGLEDLDAASLAQYRQRFAVRSPDHPWLALNDKELLIKLGGWRIDRRMRTEGLTVAGLLMFGKDEAICDRDAVPNFHVDYREYLSGEPGMRWTDRLHPNGMWAANLFQFYQRVIVMATRDLRIPFQLRDLSRVDDTPVHEAIREALTNAIVHADHQGHGGIVIKRDKNGFEMSNPGSLLVSIEQLRQGGVSECRNKALQKMFQMMGRGERAGTGIDTIIRGWRSEHWRYPTIVETLNPDRVVLYLPMISMLPDDSLARLHDRFGEKLNALAPIEVQALVTADVEGEVSNVRLQLVCDSHPAELTKALQRLVSQQFLRQGGHGRSTYYRLSPSGTELTTQVANLTTSRGRDSTHQSTATRSDKLAELTEDQVVRLRALAYPTGAARSVSRQEMRAAIRRIAAGHFRTAAQMGQILQRNPRGLREKHLKEMVEAGELELLDKQDRNNPNQAYRSVESFPPVQQSLGF
jgi:ATP-dependent DNA helicase RecG